MKKKVKVALSCVALCDPMDYTVCGILQARILEWVVFPSPEDLPNPGIEPKSPALRRGSLPAEPQGKSKNTIPSPGDLPDPAIESGSPALQADCLPAELPAKTK